jgi:serine O-acetyltransferase
MGLLTGISTVLLLSAALVLWVAIFFSRDIKATQERDPAAKGYLQIILLYAGLHALVAYRTAHLLWEMKVPFLPRFISQAARFITGIEIHPGAVIGNSFFIDHGMGVVIGETAVVGDHVTLFQGVTLGGTGKETGKRHPTVGNHVVIGAGAKVLGNITIGDNSYIGANAVVLRDVPANSTVVGVPGHITKQDGRKIDLTMDHIHVSDPVMRHMKDLIRRVKTLEEKKENTKEDISE